MSLTIRGGWIGSGLVACWLMGMAACGDTSAAGTTGSVGSVGSVTSASATASGIGVPECEAYLARMRTCIAGAPEAERSARAASLDEIEKTWLAVEGADAKARLVTPCKKMIEQLDTDGVCK